MIVWLATGASAATLVVALDGSGTHTSIQAAIDAASDGDRVEVRAGTWAEAIDLRGKGVEVVGAGPGITVLDPAGAAPEAVRVASGEPSGALVSSLTVRNGNQRGAYVSASSVTFRDVTFEDLGRIDAALNGGAALVDGGDATFEECTFTRNDGYFGGDLYVAGGATVVVSDSASSLAHGYDGGSVYVATGQVTLDRTELDGARADRDGGLVFVGASASLLSDDATFSDGYAADDGGNVFVDGSWEDHRSVVERGRTLSGSGHDGGGVYGLGAALVLDGTQVTQNTSGNFGGGLYLSGGTAQTTDLQVDHDSAKDGGGMYTSSTTWSDVGSVFRTNTASDTASTTEVGGFKLSSGVPTLTGTQVLDNRGDYDGAWITGGSGTLSRVTFADQAGVALVVGVSTSNYGTLTVRDSVFEDNAGAGIDTSTGLVVERSRFLRNVVAIDAHGGPSVAVRWSRFEDNTQGPTGTAIVDVSSAWGGASAEVLNSVFVDNDGDALSLFDVDTARVEFNRFLRNGFPGGGESGGAVRIGSVEASTVVSNTICGNSADLGGGIYASSSSIVLTGNLIQDNVATDRGGGAYLSGTALQIDQNTFVGNAGFLGGGAVWLYSSSAGTARGNVVAWTIDGDGVQGSAGVAWSYDDWYRNLGADYGGAVGAAEAYGPGTLWSSPGFTSFSFDGACNDDLTLAPGSPLVDAGPPGTLDPDGTLADIGWTGGPESALLDEDGDGSPRWLDCDDADAAAYPGASEVPHDGVDQDCAGDDDLDLDADGERWPVDCDDLDPSLTSASDDRDGDGVCDPYDLCDGDDAGGDADGDRVCDPDDRCLGDDRRGDADGDLLCSDLDPCPSWPEGVPDTGDLDADGHGDHCDDCPAYPDPAQGDVNGNGTGDACEVSRLQCPFEDAGPYGNVGAWGTGWGPGFASLPYLTTQASLQTRSWHLLPSPLSLPHATICESDTTDCQAGPFAVPRYSLLVHPSNTEGVTDRFGLGVGSVDLEITFQAGATRGTPASADVDVLVNGAQVFAGTIDGLRGDPGAIATYVGHVDSPDDHSVVEMRVRSRGSTAATDGVTIDFAGTCSP